MRSLPLPGLLVVLLVGLVSAAQASRSAAPAPRRMNIVFILTDDETVDTLAKMPFVSSYANWITFKNAFINDPMCCPSRATIATGLYSHHTGIENNNDRGKFKDGSTIATWLHAAGYETGFFGKYHLGLHGEPATFVPPGWDDWAAFPDGAYFSYTLNENGKLVHYGSAPKDYSTDVLAGKSLDFLDHVDSGKPFFLYLSTRAPHDGYTPAPRYAGRFKTAPIRHSPSFNEADMSDKPAWWRALDPRKVPDIDNARRKEYACMLAVDDAVKEIFDKLRAKGLQNNTVVLFMTDNGVTLGEHRWRGKGCAYEPCVRTPFLVAYPGEGRRTVSALVSNIDIAPTFADLAGTKPATPVDGRSIVPLMTGATPTNWPKQVLLQFTHDPSQDTPPSFWSIRTQRYKLIQTVGTGELELYDLAHDPDETQSVAGNPSYAAVQAQLTRQLTQLRNTPAHAVTLPQTAITSARIGRHGTARFTFRSSRTHSVFQCRLRPAVLWANCASPKNYRRIPRGRHTFQVRAIDPVGSTDQTPAARSFTRRG